jgi:hypothetical protein
MGLYVEVFPKTALPTVLKCAKSPPSSNLVNKTTFGLLDGGI